MMKKPLLWMVLTFTTSSGLYAQTEDCANGIDDDGDGLIDCSDPDCTGDAVPTGAFFNTAANGTGGVLPGGSNDLNWTVSTTGLGGPYTPAAVMVGIPGSYTVSPWADCSWISYIPNGSHTVDVDHYYKIQFYLPCVNTCGRSYADPGIFCLYMDFFADNSVDAIYINGILQTGIAGVPSTNPYYGGGFEASAGISVSLCQDWQPGLNELIVKVSSGPSYTGFLAQNSTATPPLLGDPTIQPLPTYTYCPDAPGVDFEGVSAGGTWSASCGTCIHGSTGVFNPSVAGIGTHTVYHEVNTPCYAIDSVDITVSSIYNATITPAGPLCLNDAPVTMTAADAGGTWSASCGTCINSSTGAFDPTIAGEGTHTIIYTISAFCGTSENETIVVKAVPAVTGTGSPNICNGGTTNINLSSSLSGTDFSWTISTIDVSGASNGSGNNITQVLNNTGPGSGSVTYTVTPSADGCMGNPAGFVVNVLDFSIDNITITNVLCSGDVNGTITVDAPGAVQYSIGSGFQSSNIFTTGPNTYTVTAENSLGCQATGTAVITQPDPLILSVNFTNETCFNFCDGKAQVTVFGGSLPYTYNWGPTFPGNNPSIDSLCTGLYTVEVSDAHGCSDSLTVGISGPSAISITGITYTPPTCNGYNDGTITVNTSGAAMASLAYSSDGGTNFQSSNVFTGIAANTYVIIAEDTNGCKATGNVLVEQPSPVVVTASADLNICLGQNALISANATGGTAPYFYTWNNGLPAATNHTVTPTGTTLYSVSVTDNNGCGPATDMVNVTVSPALNVTASNDQRICPGSSASITAVASGGNGGPYTFNWSNNHNAIENTGANQTVSPGLTTVYTVTVTDGCTTPAATDAVTIDFFDLPAMTYALDKMEGCAPLPVQFTNTTNAMICAWNFGDGNTSNNCHTSHTFTEPGCYDISLSIITVDGCTKDTIVNNQVCVYPVPVADFSFGPQPTDLLITEINFYNTSIGANGYTWNFAGLGGSNQQNPVFVFPSDKGDIYPVCLMATNTYGCRDSICRDVMIRDTDILYVPNAFTPDGDGTNDIFMAKGRSIVNFELRIFNRWGEVIFFSNDINKGWDGRHNGINAKEDTYVWQIKYSTGTNLADTKEKIGHVTLLR